MIIGTAFLGRMKTLDEQCIETKFFIFGLPLIPVSSMFVTGSDDDGRLGFDIGLHNQSVLKGYLSIWFLVLGIFLVILGANDCGIICTVAGLLAFVASIYFFFFFGKSTQEENAERQLFQKAVGVNALPVHLGRLTSMTLRNNLISRVKEVMGDKNLNWIEMGETGSYDERLLPIFFAAMGYHSFLEEKEKYYRLYDQLKQKYQQQLAQ